MSRKSNILAESPSQTAGPYLHLGLLPQEFGLSAKNWTDLGTAPQSGSLSVAGNITDGAGEPVCDALIEVSYARLGSNGQPELVWFRVAASSADGSFSFYADDPLPVEESSGQYHAPHFTFWIVARGINNGLLTRMYMPEAASEHDQDTWMQLVPRNRRETLVAKQVSDKAFRFDIHLQGTHETVFFDS